MIKHDLIKLYKFACTLMLVLCAANSAWAVPTAEMVSDLNNSVLRVKVKLPNGNLGLGSAVVIAKNEVITNCHVVTDATNIAVIVNGEPHAATAIKADWHHDLCMLTVENLDAPVVKLGASKDLQYEESVFTIGYPDETKQPVSTFGAVKGLFPMDDSVIIRASSPFRLGASGGGAFDDTGNLVGIITLKSRGDTAYFYYMPVEWVQALMSKPAQSLGVKSEKPFWAMDVKQRPYFMQVVQPYLTQEWKTLLKVATQWVQTEPNTAESWFYLAAAEYATKDYSHAEEHFKKVLALNHSHSQAMDYLAKLAEKTAKLDVVSNKVALLN
ncbi:MULTISPECIES: S1 family peptidase [Methylotenera]|uniref:S1 family peptidase n=1 Tax=Methylotenera TaxID=359407 RepID=UPI0003A1D83C|nr:MULTISPECIES: serine protease [Methylotenera]